MTANVSSSSCFWETDREKLHFDELVPRRQGSHPGSLQMAYVLVGVVSAAPIRRDCEGLATVNYLTVALSDRKIYYKMFQEIETEVFS